MNSGDRPIAVGDLVVVVRSCCTSSLGLIFRVGSIHMSPTFFGACMDCGRRTELDNGIPHAFDVVDNAGWPLAWLRRIPPISAPESTLIEEEQTA